MGNSNLYSLICVLRNILCNLHRPSYVHLQLQGVHIEVVCLWIEGWVQSSYLCLYRWPFLHDRPRSCIKTNVSVPTLKRVSRACFSQGGILVSCVPDISGTCNKKLLSCLIILRSHDRENFAFINKRFGEKLTQECLSPDMCCGSGGRLCRHS